MKNGREAWVPYAKYIGTGTVGGITMIVSGIWLVQLAELVGINWPISLSLPITVDVGGAVATLLWIKGGSKVVGWARGVAVGSLVASVIGNTISHLIKMQAMAVTPWLIIGVGAMYPATLWLMIHLLVLSGGDQTRPKATGRPATGPAVKRPSTSQRSDRDDRAQATETTGARRPNDRLAATDTRRPATGDRQGRATEATETRPAVSDQRPNTATEHGDRDDRAARPKLHAVPTEPATDATEPDVADLLDPALKFMRDLGRCPSRDELLDALRDAGHTVGGRRRSAIHAAVKAAWAAEPADRPQTTDTTDRTPVAATEPVPAAATGTTGGPTE